MVSHSPHTNLTLEIVMILLYGLLELVFWWKFCHLRKGTDNDIAHQKIFPTF